VRTVVVTEAQLKRWERYIEWNVYCTRQRSEGWYVADCIETKARRKCEPCRIRQEMRRALGKP
jgi:hypothetical protein